jgi:hypothetical protein
VIKPVVVLKLRPAGKAGEIEYESIGPPVEMIEYPENEDPTVATPLEDESVMTGEFMKEYFQTFDELWVSKGSPADTYAVLPSALNTAFVIRIVGFPWLVQVTPESVEIHT